jgi:hypothetical protein
MFAEMFSPYGPEDYRGLIDEWKALNDKTIDSRTALRNGGDIGLDSNIESVQDAGLRRRRLNE